MKSSWRIAFIAAAVVMPLAAETGAERAKRVVNECVEALGGQKFLTVTDIVQMGRAYSFYHERLSGLTIARTVTRYLNGVPDPSKTLAVVERQDYGKKLDYGVLFQQNDAYEITFRGARPLTDERFNRYKNSTMKDIFYILRERLNEPGMIFESRGADVWNNFPVEIVDITDAQNVTVTVYFHKTTKVPVREVTERRDPATKERFVEETIYTKYRTDNGVQWPLTVQRNRDGEKMFEMFSDSLEINKKLPEKNMFDLPAGMKTLKPDTTTGPH